MKQLPLFDRHETDGKGHLITWHLFFDGASRSNPGLAGAGICLIRMGELMYRRGFFLGHRTNNQAEYLALLLGLFYAHKQLNAGDYLIIASDSELLIKQMHGAYRVRDAVLKKFFDIAHGFLGQTNITYKFIHVVREKNQEADAMANKGIDKKISMPVEFIKLMRSYGVDL
jgi:ribonuclease HI